MNIPNILKPKHTIARRLTWRVLLSMTVVFALLSAFLFAALWLIGGALLTFVYGTAMQVTNEKINTVFSNVEVAVNNNVPEVIESLDKEQSTYYAQNHLLQLNPNIMGSAVALNPECKSNFGRKSAPYVYRDSTGLNHKQLNTPEYDYLNQEWFKKPCEEMRDTWSEPYIDVGGGDIPMITYSLLILNHKGEAMAIQTADIALDWLEDMTHQLDSTFNKDYNTSIDEETMGNAYLFIVTKKGTIVSHHNENMVMNKSIYDVFQDLRDNDKEDAVKEMLETKGVGIKICKDDKDVYNVVFYDKIERTGWLMTIVVPVSDIISPLNYLFVRFILLLLIGLGIVAFVCAYTIHKVTKPLTQFADSAEEIAKGNLTSELPVIKSKDEMLRLRNSFELMQASLVKQIDETRVVNEEKGRIEGELQIAHGIQMSMLPKIFPPYPERSDVDIYGLQKPAKEVGGDLYDFFIRDEKLFFCIGDVSGKGVPASLVMAVTRSLFRNIASHTAEPGRITDALNNAISDNNESNMFVTLFVGALDLPTGRLRYSNAGHDAPIILGQDQLTILPCDSNLPIGVLTDWKFTQQEIILKPQTTIFLYTDGLTEAENIHHEQFKEERIIEVAKQASHQPKAFIEEMTKAVQQFVSEAEQSDDMTMLSIQYTHEQDQEQDVLLHRNLTLPNDIEEVPQLAAFVEEVCEAVGIDMSTTMSMNLAMEEAVVNVMSYAYPTGTKGDVSIEATANKKRLKFIISDWGKPFDPTEKKEVDTTLPVDERPIGGLGIHLVRQIMDSINYERTNGKNVLTLRKKLV